MIGPATPARSSKTLIFPPLLADQRHKSYRDNALVIEALALAHPALQDLPAAAAHRDDQPPAVLQLVEQWRRDDGRGRRDNDPGEGSVLLQARGAIANVDGDIGEP